MGKTCQIFRKKALLCRIAIGFSFISPLSILAKSKVANGRTTSFYSTFSDLKLSGGEKTELASAVGLEVDFRISYIFSLIFAGSQAVDASRLGYGLGARVDLPGFLLFGSNHNRDLRRQKMKYPVNSSIYFISSLTTLKSEGASDTRTVTTIFGVTIDFFLFNPLVYLSTKASVYNLQGNSFVTMGAGLGFEF